VKPPARLAKCRLWAAVVILLGAVCPSAPAQGNQPSTTAPTTAPAIVNPIESTPIRRGSQPATPGKTTGMTTSAGLSLLRVLGAMAVVIAAILVLRWGSKRILGLPIAGGPSSAIRVLSRQVIGPRQQLMLIHVGNRILLVGNSGAQMNPLCEMTDAEEVSNLLVQIKDHRSMPPARPFWSLFRRAESRFDEEAPAVAGAGEQEQVDPDLASTREEIDGLLNKVKAISRSFKKA
jgi:flagellar biosynthetic protein FliO